MQCSDLSRMLHAKVFQILLQLPLAILFAVARTHFPSPLISIFIQCRAELDMHTLLAFCLRRQGNLFLSTATSTFSQCSVVLFRNVERGGSSTSSPWHGSLRHPQFGWPLRVFLLSGVPSYVLRARRIHPLSSCRSCQSTRVGHWVCCSQSWLCVERTPRGLHVYYRAEQSCIVGGQFCCLARRHTCEERVRSPTVIPCSQKRVSMLASPDTARRHLAVGASKRCETT